MKRIFTFMLLILLLHGCGAPQPEEAPPPLSEEAFISEIMGEASVAAPEEPPTDNTPFQVQEGILYPVGMDKVGAVNAAGELIYPFEYEFIMQLANSQCYLLRRIAKSGEPPYAIGDVHGNILVDRIQSHTYFDADPGIMEYTHDRWKSGRERTYHIFDFKSQKTIMHSEKEGIYTEYSEVMSNGISLVVSQPTGLSTYDNAWHIYSLEKLRAGNMTPDYIYECNVLYPERDSHYRTLENGYYTIRTFADRADENQPIGEGLLNPDGSICFPQGEYEDILVRENGGFLVQHEGVWTYLNANKEPELQVRAKSVEDFSGLYAKVWLGEEGGALIDKSGRLVTTQQYAAGLKTVPPYWFGFQKIESWHQFDPESTFLIDAAGNEQPLDTAMLKRSMPGYTVDYIEPMGRLLYVALAMDGSGGSGLEQADSAEGLWNPISAQWAISPGTYRYFTLWERDWEEDEDVFEEDLELIYAFKAAYPHSGHELIDVYAGNGTLLLEDAKEICTATKNYIAFVKGFEYFCITWEGDIVYRQPVFQAPGMD